VARAHTHTHTHTRARTHLTVHVSHSAVRHLFKSRSYIFEYKTVEYSVGLNGQNDLCFHCAAVRARAAAKRRDVCCPIGSARCALIGLGIIGHSREARREALAGVHARRVAPGLSVSDGIVCAGVLDEASTVSYNFKPQGSSFNRLDEINVVSIKVQIRTFVVSQLVRRPGPLSPNK